MAEILTELPEPLLAQLQSETFAMLGTIDAETGGPASHTMSWVYAPDSRTIRFAVDQRSRIVANIKANPRVSVTLFVGGSVHAAYGQAKVAAEPLEGVPFKLSCMDIRVDMIRDVMFYGSRISVAPEYEKTYDKRAAERLDQQVFTAMKKA